MFKFEEWKGKENEIPPGYQKIKCHIIFEIKLSENFRRKARFVAGGRMTEVPASLTYSTVVSRDSVRIILIIAALNGLEISSCDIQNAYFTAPCREKVYFIAGPEMGSDQGKIMIIGRAHYMGSSLLEQHSRVSLQRFYMIWGTNPVKLIKMYGMVTTCHN